MQNIFSYLSTKHKRSRQNIEQLHLKQFISLAFGIVTSAQIICSIQPTGDQTIFYDIELAVVDTIQQTSNTCNLGSYMEIYSCKLISNRFQVFSVVLNSSLYITNPQLSHLLQNFCQSVGQITQLLTLPCGTLERKLEEFCYQSNSTSPKKTNQFCTNNEAYS